MRSCACGVDPCEYPVFGYWWCPGCGDHHRLPIASGQDVLCPADVVEEADIEEAARRLGGRHDPVW